MELFTCGKLIFVKENMVYRPSMTRGMESVPRKWITKDDNLIILSDKTVFVYTTQVSWIQNNPMTFTVWAK